MVKSAIPQRMKWRHEEQRDFHMAAGGGRPKKWIQGAISHPGALHKQLGVPQGKKIPAAKLAAATHSKDPLLRKRANLAETLGKMHRR